MTVYDIARGLATQSNRGTMDPYIICLQEEAEVPAWPGNGDEKRYWCADHCYTYKSKEEFRKALGNEYTDGEVTKMENDLVEYEIKYEWQDREYFFTDDGYEKHLALNRHNYRGKVRSYLKHLFRNPEMQALFEHLRGLIQTDPVEL